MDHDRVGQRRILCAVAMAVALVLFLGTVGSGFVWDDELLFRSWLPYFDGPRAVAWPPPGIPHFLYQYYRPVLLASYLLDERMAAVAFSPEGREQGRRIFFHLTPVLLHVACTGLVFMLGMLLLRGRSDFDRTEAHHAWIAFAGALMFAVHPIHVESVAWIVGRSDSLCTLGGLASLIALIDWRRRRRWIALAGAMVFALLAMLSKEIGFGILAPAALIALAWPDSDGRGSALRARGPEVLALAILLAAYVGLRTASASQAQASFSGAGALPRLFGAVGWYAVKMLWPFPQSVFPAEEFRIAFVGVGCVAVVLAAVALIAWHRPAWRAERVALAIAVGGSAVSLLVAVTNVSTSPVAERNLYLPSAGACLLGAFLVHRLVRSWEVRWTRVPAVALLAGVLAVPSGWAVSRRLSVWDNPVAFWHEAALSAPLSAVARINHGAALAAVGRFAESEQAYEDAIRLARSSDQSAMAHANLGSLLFLQGRSDDAIAQFRQAIAENQHDAVTQFNWASTLVQKAGTLPSSDREATLNEATGHLNAALAIHPRYAKARLLLGTILLSSGEASRAQTELELAVTLDPASAEASRARTLLAGPPFGQSEGRVERGSAPVQ